MTSAHASGSADRRTLETVLGYLNFSSGATDVHFLAGLNQLFALAERFPPYDPAETVNSWQRVGRRLQEDLATLRAEQGAFCDADQAVAVIRLVFERALPAYREFHRDLLFHQRDEIIFRPLFVGRVCEAVLSQGPNWDDAAGVTQRAIARLNDYVGHRPVPVLTSRKHEPYAHERIRPVPLYIDGAGIGVGRYYQVVEIALSIIRQSDEHILRAAHLDPALMTELAFDPRAYDFDHPANKRPNYHFGQWDPHCIDNSGRYRRLVVQQITLDALMERVEHPGEVSPDEALFEGGAVLAGVMLMSTGIGGWGPEAHDSSVTLGNLLPHIAAYRDEFYEKLLERIEGPHGKRLKAEARKMKQPFASARQHLNGALTRRRASQVGHVQLAKIFARMGFAEAAHKHADKIPSTAARLTCHTDCLMTAAQQALERQQPQAAADALAQVFQTLKRGIECGAVIDPWSILGFDAHYSLFPALENSIRDFRADDLASLVEQMFNIYAGAWCAAAAANDEPLCERLSDEMRMVTGWWHPFAAHEVSAIEAPNGAEVYEAAQHVAQILRQWHEAGAAGGAVTFWAPHAQQFDSPKAYATVIAALLERRDYVATMALLVHWLSQAEQTGLEQGESSFTRLAIRWLRQLQQDQQYPGGNHPSGNGRSKWSLVKRLFDLFEANAEDYGQAPQFAVGDAPVPASKRPPKDEELPEEETEDEEGGLYGAAYEDVVYRDSTDDGFEGDILDYGQPSEDELEAESKRINLRLGFLMCLAQLWKLAAWHIQDAPAEDRRHGLLNWLTQADQIVAGLRRLLNQVSSHHIRTGGIDTESLVEFDRQRTIQEALLERIVAAHVELADASTFLLAAASATQEKVGTEMEWPSLLADDHRLAVSLIASLLRGDAREACARCAEYLDALRDVPLLYVPLGRGGNPDEILAARLRQRMLQDVLILLPRLGLLDSARQVIEMARRLERDHPVGPGAVTEFDDLFEVGYRSMVQCVLESIESWDQGKGADESRVADLLHQFTEPINRIWVEHSRTLRLSVLERVSDEKTWSQLVRFIRRYGSDLFTQQFLNLGNVRAIQHQGVEAWLQKAKEDPDFQGRLKLLDDLGSGLSTRRAVKCLSLILEAISENYVEYRDYNATTTQSDRGEMLYMLLDFLRLRVHYDKRAWELRPAVIAHETLVRRGHTQAAATWRNSLSRMYREVIGRYQQWLSQLEQQHAMKMPTVAQRLAERFVQPMVMDQLRALVEPAIEERLQGEETTHFSLLEVEADVLVDECGGVGLDVPPWLLALEDEVIRARRPAYERDEEELLADVIPQKRLTCRELDQLIQEWATE